MLDIHLVVAFFCFLLQGLIGHSLLRTRSLLWRVLAPFISLVSIFLTFQRCFRPPLQPLYPFFAAIPSFTMLKLFHAAVDGPGLENAHCIHSLSHSFLFFLLPPSLIFKPASRWRVIRVLARGLVQLLFVITVSSLLVDFLPGGPESLPWIIQRYLLGIIVVVMAAFGMDLLMTVPVCLLGYEMIECSNFPLFSLSHREFWRRHNTNVGYHLKSFIFDQTGKTLFSVFLVFFFNTLLHVFWYHPMYFDGVLGWHYVPLLMTPPLVMCIEPKNPYLRFTLLHAGFAVMGPIFARGGGLNFSLRDHCLDMLGRK
jgi:hypothetical protein